ncbi:uncharacterized protein LOC144439301 [Glandiceps talaboti]
MCSAVKKKRTQKGSSKTQNAPQGMSDAISQIKQGVKLKRVAVVDTSQDKPVEKFDAVQDELRKSLRKRRSKTEGDISKMSKMPSSSRPTSLLQIDTVPEECLQQENNASKVQNVESDSGDKTSNNRDSVFTEHVKSTATASENKSNIKSILLGPIGGKLTKKSNKMKNVKTKLYKSSQRELQDFPEEHVDEHEMSELISNRFRHALIYNGYVTSDGRGEEVANGPSVLSQTLIIQHNMAESRQERHECPEIIEYIANSNKGKGMHMGESEKQKQHDGSDLSRLFIGSNSVTEKDIPDIAHIDDGNVDTERQDTTVPQSVVMKMNNMEATDTDQAVSLSVDTVRTIENKIGDSLESKIVDSVEIESVNTIERETVDAIEKEAVDAIERGTVDAIERATVDAIERETVDTIERETVDAIERETVDAIERETMDAIERETMDAIEREAVDAIEKEAVDAIEREPADVIERVTVDAIERETVDAIEREAVDAIERETVDAIEMKTVDAIERETVDATEMKTVDATERETVDAIERETVDAIERETVDAIERETVDAIEMKTVDATERETVDTIERETVDAIERETVDAIERETVDAIERETADAIEMKTVDAIEREVVDTIERETVDTIENDIVQPMQGKPTNTTKGESFDNKEIEPIDTKGNETVETKYKETVYTKDSDAVDTTENETVDVIDSKTVYVVECQIVDSNIGSETFDTEERQTVHTTKSETIGTKDSQTVYTTCTDSKTIDAKDSSTVDSKLEDNENLENSNTVDAKHEDIETLDTKDRQTGLRDSETIDNVKDDEIVSGQTSDCEESQISHGREIVRQSENRHGDEGIDVFYDSDEVLVIKEDGEDVRSRSSSDSSTAVGEYTFNSGTDEDDTDRIPDKSTKEPICKPGGDHSGQSTDVVSNEITVNDSLLTIAAYQNTQMTLDSVPNVVDNNDQARGTMVYSNVVTQTIGQGQEDDTTHVDKKVEDGKETKCQCNVDAASTEADVQCTIRTGSVCREPTKEGRADPDIDHQLSSILQRVRQKIDDYEGKTEGETKQDAASNSVSRVDKEVSSSQLQPYQVHLETARTFEDGNRNVEENRTRNVFKVKRDPKQGKTPVKTPRPTTSQATTSQYGEADPKLDAILKRQRQRSDVDADDINKPTQEMESDCCRSIGMESKSIDSGVTRDLDLERENTSELKTDIVQNFKVTYV